MRLPLTATVAAVAVLASLASLDKTSRSESQRAAAFKVRDALDKYFLQYNNLKQQNATWDSDELPQEFTDALVRLRKQSDTAFEAVHLSAQSPMPFATSSACALPATWY